MKVGVCPGVRPEGWLSGLPTPLVVLSAGGMRSTLLLLLTPYFCSWLFRSGSWGFFFLVFLCLVHNLPHLHMQAIIFSPLQFLCILLLEETFAQVQTLQQRVPGPSLSQAEVGAVGIPVFLATHSIFGKASVL